MSTAGTGGFSNRNASIGAYQNPAAEMVIAIFLLLFSINFAIHFLLLTRRFRQVAKSDELRFFFSIIAGATVFFALVSAPAGAGILARMRHGFFTACSITSSTGFTLSDHALWPYGAQVALLILMICGGCAGSTSSGVKTSRVLLCLRCVQREISRIIHPRTVRVVKLDGNAIEERTLHSVSTYLVCYFALLMGTSLITALDGASFETAFSAAITCLSNAGPGLGAVGPMGNYNFFSPLTKMILSVTMIVGRLEIMPMLVLLSPAAWKKS